MRTSEQIIANRIKDEFLAVLAHELRSSLHPILGWSKLLQSRKFDEAKLTYALQSIERNALLQSHLIEDLLDVSHILQGNLSLKVCPVELAPIIEAALESLRFTAQAKSIQILTVFEPHVGQILGDSNRLQQVVWNLLFDAIKFTPPRGQVEVRLSEVEREKTSDLLPYVQIQVSDTGGISPDLPYMFDYFHQADSTTTRTGGLGLAIVRYLVELHGGTVQAESPGVGLGVTSTIFLPVRGDGAKREAQEKRTGVRRKENLSTPSPHHPITPSPLLPRILLVEDNDDTRDYLKLLLQERFEVEALADGAAALASVRHRVPDLVLSDVMMPGLDGFELLRELRADPHTKEVPFILLSALTDVESTIEGLEAGADDYLGKPFSTRELFARVGANLELARMRREVHYERAARVEADQARKELEKLNQLKDDFLSTVSHELRTPMTNIKMAIQMLQVANTPELRHRYMQILQVECTREIDLINNLLDLQRLESGTAAVEWSQFQLQEWLIPIVDPFMERAQSHQQTLRLELSPLPYLLSDPVNLERVVAELLNNACKYTPKGGEITITARPKSWSKCNSPGVELIVSNSGCEIPEPELVRIFEKFYRVQNSDPWKQGGTGLGLALVQKLVALLGGRIWAESEENKVIFTVELPGNNS